MALFDFLKPKWSADKMAEEDRQRQFWLLKRGTSYTAWAGCRDRYAAFVDLLEQQCKEEPLGRIGPKQLAIEMDGYKRLVAQGVFKASDLVGIENSYVTKWESSTYTDALKGLASYDKGLARLIKGDRSVWMHNSRGDLEDAYFKAEHYYALIYQGGRNGGDGMVFYGKYVHAMKAALLWAMDHGGFRASGLQPAMAQMSSGEIWSETKRVDFMGTKDKLILGTRDSLLRETAHLKVLPRTPTPTEEVVVRSGEPVPAFGIYEPQVKDGVMTYMQQGAEALRYGEPCGTPGGGQVVSWKLIWADDRYLDGVIPDEEADYFSHEPMPDFSVWVGEEVVDMVPSNELVTARTGQPAVYSGTWAVNDDLSGRVLWRKGDKLPQHKGREVDWVFVGKA